MTARQSVFLILAMLAATPFARSREALPAKFVAARDGGHIAYYPVLEANTVPVIVLSGGPGTDSPYMRARGALDRLSKIRSIVFYDQRGTSRSVDSNGSETIDAVAMHEFLEDVRQHRSNLDVNNALREDMANRDYWPQVRQFRQPSLVIHGRYDAVIAPANSWALHRALQDSTFHIIETAGHLQHVERPDAFLDVVTRFLQAQDRASPQSR